MNKEKSFVIHRENGFALNLPNGIRISTIFGWGSYTENRRYGEPEVLKLPMDERIKKQFSRIPEGSKDVEIMIDCPDRKWLKRINKKYNNGVDSSVIGHLTIYGWFEILKKCWRWKPKEGKK